MCVHVSVPNFFWCFLDSSSNIVPRFINIWLHLLEIWGFVFCPKLRARFHVLCVHARTCTCTNILNQLRKPILKYAEGFIKILPQSRFYGFYGFCSKLRACFHVLCVQASTCTRTNTFNQLRRPILKYAEDFMKIWLHLAEILRCVTR